MIPFGIMSGKLHGLSSRPLEIRILDLWAEGFTFRLSNRYTENDIRKIQEITLFFLNWEKMENQVIPLTDFKLKLREKTEWYSVYETSFAYQESAVMVMQEYLHYISLKLEADPADLSEELTGYPAVRDCVFPASFLEWKRGLLTNSVASLKGDWAQILSELEKNQTEIAVSINRPALYQRYLQSGQAQFCSSFRGENNLDAHPFASIRINTILIGNGYCGNLFPDRECLIRLFSHTLELGLKPVIVLPPVQTGHMDDICRIVCALENAYPNSLTEYVVNDWGMADWMHDTFGEKCKLTLGILLNKKRKDVRLPYKKRSRQYLFLNKENQLNDPFFRERIKNRYGIEKYTYEACGYPYEMADGHHVLHLPFYQMNTAGFCTLSAKCRRGDRAAQSFIPYGACSHDCETHTFLYPEHLGMVGYGNSLFGYDHLVMEDSDYVREILCRKPSRLVFEMLW